MAKQPVKFWNWAADCEHAKEKEGYVNVTRENIQDTFFRAPCAQMAPQPMRQEADPSSRVVVGEDETVT